MTKEKGNIEGERLEVRNVLDKASISQRLFGKFTFSWFETSWKSVKVMVQKNPRLNGP